MFSRQQQRLTRKSVSSDLGGTSRLGAHLPDDDFNVLVVHADALQAVDFLDLVDQELLHFLGAPDLRMSC